jgi:hypothetical protein
MAGREHWWQGINLGLAVTIVVSTAVSLSIVGLSADASRDQAQLDRRQAAYADLIATSSECTSDSRYASLRLTIDLLLNDHDEETPAIIPPGERLDDLWASSFGLVGECQGDMDSAVARMMIDGAPAYVLIAADRLVILTSSEIETNTTDAMNDAGASNAVDEIVGATTTTTQPPGEPVEAPATLDDARLNFIASAQVDRPMSTADIWIDRLPLLVAVVGIVGTIMLAPWAWRQDRKRAAKRAGTPPPAPPNP